MGRSVVGGTRMNRANPIIAFFRRLFLCDLSPEEQAKYWGVLEKVEQLEMYEETTCQRLKHAIQTGQIWWRSDYASR